MLNSILTISNTFACVDVNWYSYLVDYLQKGRLIKGLLLIALFNNKSDVDCNG